MCNSSNNPPIRQQKARKQYLCSCCGLAIFKGNYYQSVSFVARVYHVSDFHFEKCDFLKRKFIGSIFYKYKEHLNCFVFPFPHGIENVETIKEAYSYNPKISKFYPCV